MQAGLAQVPLGAALATVPAGWTWELRRFSNHPWAVQYKFVLHSPHDEPVITTYGLTASLAVLEAVQATG
jgi:hypothetical protein